MTHRQLLDAYENALGLDSSRSRFEAGEWNSLLSAALPVPALAGGSVAAFATAVDRFSFSQGQQVRRWSLDPNRIAGSFSGDAMMRIDGEPVRGFAELSGFFRSADGWIRTHANYPHHRRALTEALELDAGADASALARRVAGLRGDAIEERCFAASAIAVRVRPEGEWFAAEGHPLVSLPLVTRTEREDTVRTARSASPRADKPLSGVRVLDLTRVIAGPVATRALALLGASVLRVDPPQLPEIEWQHLENGQGKKSALIDLHTEAGLETVQTVVADADVVVTGYRPGALELFESVLPPGIVHARVSAWGPSAWSGRRGFDSIVQAVTGISMIEGSPEKPGALHAQALDHASGYLLAAAIVDALAQRRTGKAGVDVSVSLARTAAWLLAVPGREQSPNPAVLPPVSVTSLHGSVRTARPALARYDDYDAPSRRWGGDEPAFGTDSESSNVSPERS